MYKNSVLCAYLSVSYINFVCLFFNNILFCEQISRFSEIFPPHYDSKSAKFVSRKYFERLPVSTLPRECPPLSLRDPADCLNGLGEFGIKSPREEYGVDVVEKPTETLKV